MKYCNQLLLQFTCSLFSRTFLPPATPYGDSYGKLQSLTRNIRHWNKRGNSSVNDDSFFDRIYDQIYMLIWFIKYILLSNLIGRILRFINICVLKYNSQFWVDINFSTLPVHFFIDKKKYYHILIDIHLLITMISTKNDVQTGRSFVSFKVSLFKLFLRMCIHS